MPKPRGGGSGPVGLALSDDFLSNKFGVLWSLHDPRSSGMQRVRHETGGLHLAATGTSPVDSAPLVSIPGDRSYVAEAALDLVGNAEGGLLLFYSPKAFVGIEFSPRELKTFEYADELSWMRSPMPTSSVRIRLTNDRNVITFHYSHDDGKTWVLHGLRMEVSGLHHNVFGGFLGLRIGIYGANESSIVVRDFTYRALDPS